MAAEDQTETQVSHKARPSEAGAERASGAGAPRRAAAGAGALDAAATTGGAAGDVVAFFDLDGTLVIGNTQFLMVQFLRSAGIVSRRFVAGSALWFLGYKAGLVKVTEEARGKAASMLRGLTLAEADSLMARFRDDVLLPRLHAGAYAALQEHRAAGHRLVVLSAALDPVVAVLCAYLDVTDFAGAPCETSEGRYTGRLSGPTPYGERKAQVAAAFMRRWGSDPRDCWAYADHTTDIALLRSIGHPVAVHPRSGLAEAAHEAGWPILP